MSLTPITALSPLPFGFSPISVIPWSHRIAWVQSTCPTSAHFYSPNHVLATSKTNLFISAWLPYLLLGFIPYVALALTQAPAGIYSSFPLKALQLLRHLIGSQPTMAPCALFLHKVIPGGKESMALMGARGALLHLVPVLRVLLGHARLPHVFSLWGIQEMDMMSCMSCHRWQ